MNGMQRLARAERDAVELHQALAEAVRRMLALRRERILEEDELPTADLLAILLRTAQSKPATVELGSDREAWWQRNSDEAIERTQPAGEL